MWFLKIYTQYIYIYYSYDSKIMVEVKNCWLPIRCFQVVIFDSFKAAIFNSFKVVTFDSFKFLTKKYMTSYQLSSLTLKQGLMAQKWVYFQQNVRRVLMLRSGMCVFYFLSSGVVVRSNREIFLSFSCGGQFQFYRGSVLGYLESKKLIHF